MAIDFPASPINGQNFYSSSNNVTYQYNATYQAWFPVSMTGTGTVDFFAKSAQTLTGTTTAIVFPTVISGNSGNWLNLSNGRFTPPAGRYHVTAGVTINNSAAATVEVDIRKNGVSALYGINSAPAGWQGVVTDGNFDCSGTDYIDVTGYANTGTTSSPQHWFTASTIPIFAASQVAPGFIGVPWRQLGRVVPTAGQATVDFQNVPSDINDLELRFDVTPVTNTVAFEMQFYDGSGVLDATAAHYLQSKMLASTGTGSGAAPSVYTTATEGSINDRMLLSTGVAGINVSNSASGGGINGRGTITNIRDAATRKRFHYQAAYANDAFTAVIFLNGTAERTTLGAITGLRLFWSSGNFAAGGAITLWGSP